MSGHTRSVHEEHRVFAPRLDEILALAEGAGELLPAELKERGRKVHEFLAHELLPHAVAEGRIMAPLAEVGGRRELGVKMTICHAEVAKLTDELEELLDGLTGPRVSAGQLRAFQRVLFGIHALLSGHFAEAESVLQQMLEARLSAAEREEVFRQIDRSAEELRSLFE